MPEPVPPSDASAAIPIEVKDFGEGLMNPSHECCRECSHGALHKTAIVDCAQLIEQQIGGVVKMAYSMAATSRLTRMFSFRTFFEALASRVAFSIASVWWFIRSIARRMYAPLERCSISAHRLLVSNTSSDSFSEMARIILLLYRLDRYRPNISMKMVCPQGSRSFPRQANMAV